MHDIDTTPEYGRIPEVCRRFALSRSRLYLLAGEGLVCFVKVGGATLVDLRSVRDYLATCPRAQVRAPKAAEPPATPKPPSAVCGQAAPDARSRGGSHGLQAGARLKGHHVVRKPADPRATA
jgi:hypothetical protein